MSTRNKIVRRIWDTLEGWIPILAVIFVVVEPLVSWFIESFSSGALVKRNPYTLNDYNMLLLTSLLLIVYQAVTREKQPKSSGDEDKIILNRNESDYYEIWEEIRGHRDVTIEALGHSFNTLWYNFIKKLLYEFIADQSRFDAISIKLVSTVEQPYSFLDISKFFESLDAGTAKKLKITLIQATNSASFFTGLCVNRSALWLSIREPHRTVKANEHVREWRRGSSATAAKMVNWFCGIIDHFDEKFVNRDEFPASSPQGRLSSISPKPD